jgi:hypothetical protein
MVCVPKQSLGENFRVFRVIRDIKFFKMFQHTSGSLFDNIAAHIGIQHIPCHSNNSLSTIKSADTCSDELKKSSQNTGLSERIVSMLICEINTYLDSYFISVYILLLIDCLGENI